MRTDRIKAISTLIESSIKDVLHIYRKIDTIRDEINLILHQFVHVRAISSFSLDACSSHKVVVTFYPTPTDKPVVLTITTKGHSDNDNYDRAMGVL